MIIKPRNGFEFNLLLNVKLKSIYIPKLYKRL